MEKLSVSEFKATCLAVLERVRQTGEPVLITKHGQPVAEVVPPRPAEKPRRSFLGSLRGTASIVDDLTAPVMTADDFARGTLEDWDEVNGKT
jgi:prevent-host-death family protein